MSHPPTILFPPAAGRVLNGKRSTVHSVQTVATHLPAQRVVSEWYENNIINEKENQASKEIKKLDLELNGIEINSPNASQRRIKPRTMLFGGVMLLVLIIVITLSVLLSQGDDELLKEYEDEDDVELPPPTLSPVENDGGLIPGVFDADDITNACAELQRNGEVGNGVVFIACLTPDNGRLCGLGSGVADLGCDGGRCNCAGGQSVFQRGSISVCSDNRDPNCEPFPFPV